MIAEPLETRRLLTVTPELVSSIGGTITDIELSGGLAYVAMGSSLTILDVSVPSQVTTVSQVSLTAPAHDIAISGSYAYVADGYDGLQVINISDPSAPTMAGSYTDGHGGAGKVRVLGTYAYVAYAMGGGMRILDVTNPAAPTLVSQVGGTIVEFTIVGTTAYLFNWSQGLDIYDISDPATPVSIGTYQTGWNSAHFVGVDGYAYFDVYAYNDEHMEVLDISNPAAVTLVRRYEHQGLGIDRVLSLDGTRLYAAEQTGGLALIDISDPATPTRLGTYGADGKPYEVVVAGSSAYVADLGGLQILDLSDPAAPVRVGGYETVADELEHISVAGSYAYVTGRTSSVLHVIDISNPAAPRRVGAYYSSDLLNDVKISGTYAYLVDRRDGLLIIDISNPSDLHVVGSYDTNDINDGASSVAVVGSQVYLPYYNDGLLVLDVTNPALPVLVGLYPITTTNDVTVVGPYAYLATNQGLTIVDISNPATPTYVGSYIDGKRRDFVEASGSQAYLGISDYPDNAGVDIIDISNPAAPALAGALRPYSAAAAPSVGQDLYLADVYTGLWIVDVTDPTAPVQMSQLDTNGYLRGMVLAGAYAYMADGVAGFKIARVAPSVPYVSIDGTNGDDSITVVDANGVLTVTVNGLESYYVTADVLDLTINALGGNDTVSLDPSVALGVTINGDDGDDSIVGGSGGDVISGGAGNDTIRGRVGDDTITGGTGNDSILGGVGADFIAGNDGLDNIAGREGNDTIYGGPSADSISGDDGDNSIYGGSGNDTIFAGTGNDTALGESDDDFIIGEDGDDLLAGGAGNDVVRGQAGNDRVLGNDGHDSLNGGLGMDSLDGGAGDDLLVGDNPSVPDVGDRDRLIGGDGNDTCKGGPGADTLYGNSGSDSLLGDGGPDLLYGGPDGDTLTGGPGADTMVGDAGDDWFFAADQMRDVLRGDAGIDHVRADNGPIVDLLVDEFEDILA